MAKESGMGMTLTVDDSGGSGRNISNDVTSVNLATPRGISDSTGINSSAKESLLLLADGSYSISGIFNDASNMSHDVFSTVPTTSVSRSVVQAISGQTMTMECNFTDYALSRAQDGSLTWSASGQQTTTTAPTWS